MALASSANTTGELSQGDRPSSAMRKADAAGLSADRGARRLDRQGADQAREVGAKRCEGDVPLVLSVAAAAEMLGISDDLVYELIEREQLPCLRLGRRKLVPRRAIELLVESVMSGFQPEHVLSVLQLTNLPEHQ